MNANLTLDRTHGTAIVVAAALSTLIAIGVLAGVTDLFQSRGEPLAQLVAAERACAGQLYVSDRESCVREWLAVSRGHRMARR